MMKDHPNLRIVATGNAAPEKRRATPSRAYEIAKLSGLLFASLVLWAGLIWYCVMMWRAR